MDKIQYSTENSSHIIQMINTIACRTNLLALDAAIEAAHARSEGSGFAAIAEGVCFLAVQCTEAAKNTSELIAQSFGNMAYGVQTNEEVLLKLKEIQKNMAVMSAMIAEISEESEMQAGEAIHLNEDIGQTNRSSKHVAAHAKNYL